MVQNQCYIFFLPPFIYFKVLAEIYFFLFPDVSNPFKVRLILTLRLSADWMIVYSLTSQYLTYKVRTVNTLVQFAAQLIIYSILPSCFSILPCMYLFFFCGDASRIKLMILGMNLIRYIFMRWFDEISNLLGC